MIDDYKMYVYINWFLFATYLSLSIIIMANTSISYNEYGFVYLEDSLKYLINLMPLIFSYPFLHLFNEHNYDSGLYRRFINRRIRNVI